MCGVGRVAAVLAPHAPNRVGLEAGPMSEWPHTGLARCGLEPVLMKTRQVRAALKRMGINNAAGEGNSSYVLNGGIIEETVLEAGGISAESSASARQRGERRRASPSGSKAIS